MHCLWNVACGHVCELFGRKFVQEKIKLLHNIKMIGSVNVNLLRRWDERKYVWEGWKEFMYHKSSKSNHTNLWTKVEDQHVLGQPLAWSP